MRPLANQDWDESLQHIIDEMGGNPINIHRLMANHPKFIRAWWKFRTYSVRGGDLSQRHCELVILRVAVRTRCWYEWAAHVDRGLQAGLERTEIDRIAGRGTGWDLPDALLVQAVDELFDEYRIRPGTRQQLAVHFTDRQILDIVSLQGLYVGIAGMIGTWGLTIEDELAARLPDDITEKDFRRRLSAADSH